MYHYFVMCHWIMTHLDAECSSRLACPPALLLEKSFTTKNRNGKTLTARSKYSNLFNEHATTNIMARADFAFPSKSSKEIRRPNSQVSDRSQPKCNDLIERRSVHDLRTLQHLEYVETDEMKNSADEERLPTQSPSGVVDVCMMGKVKKPPKSLLRRRRPGPWTSRRPLLKSLYPRMASELEEFERSRKECSKDKNFLPSHKNSEPPGIIKFGSNTSKPPLSMRLPTANIIKWKPSVQKKRMQKNPMPSRMTKTAPKQTIEMIQHKDNNRKERQAKTKERIQLAKKKRGELYNAKIKKIEDTLEKKEQKRLSSIRCNEIEMQQTKLLTAIILASATRRWLKNAPVILAECRRKKLLEEAAIKIQTRWKKEMFVRKAFIASTINKKLKLCGWRLKLHARCNRRSLYAKIIRTFLIDMTKHPLSFALYEFRSRILKAQRLTRNFLDCKRARLYALEELWKRVEKKIILSEESKSKRRRHKNALSDITHRKILSKGLAGIVKGAVNHADQQTSSVSSHVQEMTPHGTYRVLCQFHLEDSRRTFKEHIHKKMPSRIHDLCHDDARKLLEGFDNVRLAQYHTVRPFPAYLLYSRYDEFRKKIEGMKKMINFNL